jgi:hypothetical protein
MRFLFIFLTLLYTLTSCGSGNAGEAIHAESALDAGRGFIDGCLKGEFKKAALYMLQDEENRQDLEKLEKSYAEKPGNDKTQYKQASIIIEELEAVSDTVSIINYRNSFDRVARKLKVVKRENEWRVDFKYTFSGNI